MKVFTVVTLLFSSLFIIIGINAQVPESLILVENKVTKGPLRDRRHIFFLLPEPEMSFESIKGIFDANRKKFCEPYDLEITIFSDREQLQKAINFEIISVSYSIEFRDDDAGREASRKYYEKVYPSSSGYLRAEYNRFGTYEFYEYGLIKNDPTMTRVSLEGKSVGTAGGVTKPCRKVQ
jgi:hypothetical protein